MPTISQCPKKLLLTYSIRCDGRERPLAIAFELSEIVFVLLLIMARPKNLRQQRLGNEIRQYLADILRTFGEENAELNGLLIELTDVRLTPDLQQVRAYILTVPAEKVDYCVRLLNQHHKELRYALAQKIRHFVKVMPTVQFFPDETEIKARRIEELLQKLPPSTSDSSDSGSKAS